MLFIIRTYILFIHLVIFLIKFLFIPLFQLELNFILFFSSLFKCNINANFIKYNSIFKVSYFLNYVSKIYLIITLFQT